MKSAIVDTGPLVTFLDRHEPMHIWTKKQFVEFELLLSCEAVLTETFHLLRRVHNGQETLLRMLDIGLLQVPYHLNEDLPAIQKLMHKYHDLPVSLADACLVRMAERNPRLPLLTLDAHFKVYRGIHGKALNVRFPDR